MPVKDAAIRPAAVGLERSFLPAAIVADTLGALKSYAVLVRPTNPYDGDADR